MKILCVIPSRMASTRLLRKPLLPIQGKPMVQHVYENASRCDAFTQVVVATDNQEIADVITSVGGKAILTDPAIQTGSDRAAVVAMQYPDMDVVVNLQGDEPFIQPAMLEKLVEPYLNQECPDMTTLARPLDFSVDYPNPGAVKVVVDLQYNALYFSRAPIPFQRESVDKLPVYHHVGLYAFRREFLLHYHTLPKTPLEISESLEQLRALEHGFHIRVCITDGMTLEINTPEEYQAALQWAETKNSCPTY